MSGARDRFYKEVGIGGGNGAWSILLDGRPLKTPARAALVLPAKALAEAVAQEWRGQSAKIEPHTMILTKLANTAIDRVAANRALVAEQVLDFARSDLVCYRAEGPEGLVARQTAQWDPILAWARTRHGAALASTTGIGFVAQTPEALAALEGAIAAHDDVALAALHSAAALAGSSLIALALSDGMLTAEEAFEIAELDRLYQAERWGQDAEAERAARARAAELVEIARFLKLLRN